MDKYLYCLNCKKDTLQQVNDDEFNFSSRCKACGMRYVPISDEWRESLEELGCHPAEDAVMPQFIEFNGGNNEVQALREQEDWEST